MSRVTRYTYVMSRGHGGLQRALLEDLRKDLRGRIGKDTWELARHFYGSDLTPANLSSVRRALRRLEAEGLVERSRYSFAVHGSPDLWRAV